MLSLRTRQAWPIWACDFMRFFHGTTSEKAEKICRGGFLPVSYFTTSLDDAQYYAATGGESDLQDREEAWEADNDCPPRDHFGDNWEMFEALYPEGQHPVIIVVDLDAGLIAQARPDNGAEGAIVLDIALSADCISDVLTPSWDEITTENLVPSP